MVQFPQFCFHGLFIQPWITGSRPLGYPIRLSTDQGMFAPPRRFSQLAAAFLASIRQGIRRKPFSRLTILLFPLKLLKFQRSEFVMRISTRLTNPFLKHFVFRFPSLNYFLTVVICQITSIYSMGRGRFELPTPALSEQCSNQLSYQPNKKGRGREEGQNACAFRL